MTRRSAYPHGGRISLLLATALLLASSCGKDDDDTGDSSPDTNPDGWEYVIATWAGGYHLIDPATGEDLHYVEPLEEGMTDLLEPTISHDGQRAYFRSIPDGAPHHELYGADLLDGGNLTRYTEFEYAGLANPHASPTDDLVVFEAAESGGTTSIYLLDAGTPTALTSPDDTMRITSSGYTTDSWGDSWPSFAPDGSQLAFHRLVHADDGYFTVIVGMSPDGSESWEIYSEERDDSYSNLCWSSDGQWIIASTGAAGDADKRLVAFDVDAGTKVDITEGLGGLALRDHACAPSGMGLVLNDIQVSPSLFTATLDDSGGSLSVTGLTQLGTEAGFREPDWCGSATGGSPPDHEVPDDTGDPQPASEYIVGAWSDGYYLVNPLTGEDDYHIEPLDTGMSGLSYAALSPVDGRVWFASIPADADHEELYSADALTGTGLQQWTSFDYQGLAEPDVSSVDGRVTFYAAESGGVTSIYVLDPDDGTPTALTAAGDPLDLDITDEPTEANGDRYPAWSPDGSRIAFYRIARGDGSFDVIVGLDPDTGETSVIFARERDADLRNLAWTSDGAWIIASTGAQNDSGKSILAVEVATGTLVDMTADFDGYTVKDHWTSPTGMKLVFTEIAPSPHLYTADLTISGSSISAGNIQQLTDENHYREPSWGLLP